MASGRIRWIPLLAVASAVLAVGLSVQWRHRADLEERIDRLENPPDGVLVLRADTAIDVTLQRTRRLRLLMEVETAPVEISLSPGSTTHALPTGIWVLKTNDRSIPVLLLEDRPVTVDLAPAPIGYAEIPAGPFLSEMMGKLQDVFAPHAKTPHDSSYAISISEVSVAEYEKFLIALGRHRGTEDGMAVEARQHHLPFGPFCGEDERAASPKGCLGHRPVVGGLDIWPKLNRIDGQNLAVRQVTFFDAAAYCNFLTARAESDENVVRYRLPSRSEWEKAARGVDGRPFAWGYSPGNTTQRVMDGGFLPVNGRVDLASPYGVLHMDGSVAEWVDGKEGATRRIVMGRTWDLHTDRVHLGHGVGEVPWFRGPYVGFRVAAELAR